MAVDDADLPDIPIICEECGTESTVSFSSVESVLERHNEQVHGGEAVAEIDPAVKSRLQDLLAEELELF